VIPTAPQRCCACGEPGRLLGSGHVGPLTPCVPLLQVSTRQFVRFLVDSPLPAPAPGQQPASGTSHCQPAGGNGGVTTADEAADRAVYGTFHMQYWLGLALVAVSVVDVLPKCLSSVYMFWDKRCE
jgi:Arginine-tRNA-protein transferase, C terminus